MRCKADPRELHARVRPGPAAVAAVPDLRREPAAGRPRDVVRAVPGVGQLPDRGGAAVEHRPPAAGDHRRLDRRQHRWARSPPSRAAGSTAAPSSARCSCRACRTSAWRSSCCSSSACSSACFPVGGAYSFGLSPEFSLAFFGDAITYFWLPFWSLVLVFIGGQAVGMRSMAIYELGSDYVNYGRGLGLRGQHHRPLHLPQRHAAADHRSGPGDQRHDRRRADHRAGLLLPRPRHPAVQRDRTERLSGDLVDRADHHPRGADRELRRRRRHTASSILGSGPHRAENADEIVQLHPSLLGRGR